MKTIAVITDKEVTGEKIKFPDKFSERKAARAVLIDTNNKIVLMKSSKNNFHKLPGGGIEDQESTIQALRRELIEETGCAIKDIKELGKIVEYRAREPKKQESFVYVCSVFGNKQDPQFTEGELEEGFSLVWLDLNNSIEAIEKENPTDYVLKFIRLRDLTILKEFAKNNCGADITKF